MTAATTAAVDPITLTVIWNSLISIADELGVTLRHTAFSEGVREGDDFATALFDRHAVLVAQGNFSPGHLGSMPAMAKHVLRYFPAETTRCWSTTRSSVPGIFPTPTRSCRYFSPNG